MEEKFARFVNFFCYINIRMLFVFIQKIEILTFQSKTNAKICYFINWRMPKSFISCFFLQINVNYITHLQIKYVCIDFMFTEQRPNKMTSIKEDLQRNQSMMVSVLQKCERPISNSFVLQGVQDQIGITRHPVLFMYHIIDMHFLSEIHTTLQMKTQIKMYQSHVTKLGQEISPLIVQTYILHMVMPPRKTNKRIQQGISLFYTKLLFPPRLSKNSFSYFRIINMCAISFVV